MTRVTYPIIDCTVAEFARWLSNYTRFTHSESCDAKGYIVTHDPPLVIILPTRSCRTKSAGVYWRRCTASAIGQKAP